MLIAKVTTVTGEIFNVRINDNNNLADFERTLRGAGERGSIFIDFHKTQLEDSDVTKVILNVNTVSSVVITEKEDSKDVTLKVKDESNLNAAKTIVKLEGEELNKAQLDKQPEIKTRKAANEREAKLRKEQGLS